jgi:type III pantothenate kinase
LRWETNDPNTDASVLAGWLRSNIDAPVGSASCASVVPSLDRILSDACALAFEVELWFLRPSGQSVIEVLYQPVSSVGADRIANGIAARNLVGSPCVVVDIGTATTFDVVDETGRFVGGAITAGPESMNSSLTSHTEKLPIVSPGFPERSIGCDTVSALQSGLYWGYVEMIDGLARRISKEIEGEPVFVATGGLGQIFAEHCQTLSRYEPNLTLDGIRLAYEGSHRH